MGTILWVALPYVQERQADRTTMPGCGTALGSLHEFAPFLWWRWHTVTGRGLSFLFLWEVNHGWKRVLCQVVQFQEEMHFKPKFVPTHWLLYPGPLKCINEPNFLGIDVTRYLTLFSSQQCDSSPVQWQENQEPSTHNPAFWGADSRGKRITLEN